MQRKLFLATTGNDVADGWPQCYFGASADGKDYGITTNNLKTDEISDPMIDAGTASKFMAGLLNAYFNGVDVSKMSPERIMAMGTIDTDEVQYNPNQTTIF